MPSDTELKRLSESDFDDAIFIESFLSQYSHNFKMIDEIKEFKKRDESITYRMQTY